MVSKKTLSKLRKLNLKKYREKYNLFSAEGVRCIDTFIKSGVNPVYCFASLDTKNYPFNVSLISPKELNKLSNHSTPSMVWAAFELPKPKKFVKQKINIALDGINDPGNLGTIIRVCDWFGIKHLICSQDTVDCFNPKVVQASMGSLCNVCVSYRNLEKYFKHNQYCVVGADTRGLDIYNTEIPKNVFFVFGNESHGISKNILDLIDLKIKIPSSRISIVESLNVASSTSIIVSEIYRRLNSTQK